MLSSDHMASSSPSTSPPPSYFTHLPLPPSSPFLSGEKSLEDDGSRVSIHIVTTASQLPVEFLEPSPQTQLVIGFDCEGVDLCRNGTLCLMQLAFPDAIYLVDAIQGGDVLVKACKPALESNYVTKVIHDCKRDSEALYFEFGIKLNNVVETQVMHHMDYCNENPSLQDQIDYVVFDCIVNEQAKIYSKGEWGSYLSTLLLSPPLDIKLSPDLLASLWEIATQLVIQSIERQNSEMRAQLQRLEMRASYANK